MTRVRTRRRPRSRRPRRDRRRRRDGQEPGRTRQEEDASAAFDDSYREPITSRAVRPTHRAGRSPAPRSTSSTDQSAGARTGSADCWRRRRPVPTADSSPAAWSCPSGSPTPARCRPPRRAGSRSPRPPRASVSRGIRVACFRPAGPPASAARKPGPAANEPEAFYRGEPIAIDLAFGPPASAAGKSSTTAAGRSRASRSRSASATMSGRPGQQDRGRAAASTRPTRSPRAPDVQRHRRAARGPPLHPHRPRRHLPDRRPAARGAVPQPDRPRPRVRAVRRIRSPRPPRRSGTSAASATMPCWIRRFGLPREGPLTVRYSDTNQPARDATVRARGGRSHHAPGRERRRDRRRTDGRRCTSAPASTSSRSSPRSGLPTSRPEIVDGRPARRSRELADLELEPAAIVTMEALDAKTGAGIEGVRFQYETDTSRQRRSLPSQLVVVDHPATDDAAGCARSSSRGASGSSSSDRPARLEVRGLARRGPVDPRGRPGDRRSASVSRRSKNRRRTRDRGSAFFPEDLVEKWRRQQRAEPGRGSSASAIRITSAAIRSPPTSSRHSSTRTTWARAPTRPRRSRPGSRQLPEGPTTLLRDHRRRPASAEHLSTISARCRA